MNKVFMNTVSLAKDPFIRKGEGGGGGGVTINNQQKSVDITENGTTEVTADAGFTGLSKVVVNTNVQSGGGSDMPVIGDGKTYLYIKIAAEGRMDVPLYFQQTVANGVTIDWGDGSPTETLSGTGDKNTIHKYAAIGDYVISLNPAEGCTLVLGRDHSSYSVMGSTGNNGRIYCNMLTAVEIGKGVERTGTSAFHNCYSLKTIVIPESVTYIGSSVFSNCYSLASVVIPESVTYINTSAFEGCYSLETIVIPESVTEFRNNTFSSCYSLKTIVIPESVREIGSSVFSNCHSLASVVIPESVTSIDSYAFQNCYGAAFYDFSNCMSVPSLGYGAFSNIPSDCKIIVPDALYDEWIAATNWSSFASNIIKKSDWDASQS